VLIDTIDDATNFGTPHNVKPDDVTFIQFSSGSTAEPKGVVLTHRNVTANIASIVDSSGLSSAQPFLSWMPLTHDMGLIGFHLTPFLLNTDQVILPTELFVRRPFLWLLKATEKRTRVTCSPNFGYKHFLKAFDAEKGKALDLSNIRLIFNGAEPISEELCHEFTQTLLVHGLAANAIYPVYGLAEASLAATFPHPETPIRVVIVDRHALKLGDHVKLIDPASTNSVKFVSVGRAVACSKVRVSDHSNAAFRENIIGHVQVAGDNVTRTYYRNDAANQHAFTADGWLDTGDLGFINGGDLVITGRAKDIIFCNGQNYFPHDLEEVVAKNENVELGKVAACGVRKENATSDEVIVFVLHRGSVEKFVPLARAIHTHVNKYTGLSVAHVIPVGKIPKTTSGKIQRYLLGAAYMQGEYSEILSELEGYWDHRDVSIKDAQNTLEQRLMEICYQSIDKANFNQHDNLLEIGTSSLALAQIFEQVDKLYPGQLDITDFFDYPTISQLANYLGNKLNQAPSSV